MHVQHTCPEHVTESDFKSQTESWRDAILVYPVPSALITWITNENQQEEECRMPIHHPFLPEVLQCCAN